MPSLIQLYASPRRDFISSIFVGPPALHTGTWLRLFLTTTTKIHPTQWNLFESVCRCSIIELRSFFHHITMKTMYLRSITSRTCDSVERGNEVENREKEGNFHFTLRKMWWTKSCIVEVKILMRQWTSAFYFFTFLWVCPYPSVSKLFSLLRSTWDFL